MNQFKTLEEIPNSIWTMCLVHDPMFGFIVPKFTIFKEEGEFFIQFPIDGQENDEILSLGNFDELDENQIKHFNLAIKKPQNAYFAINPCIKDKQIMNRFFFVYHKGADKDAYIELGNQMIEAYKEDFNIQTVDDLMKRVKLSIKEYNSLDDEKISFMDFMNIYEKFPNIDDVFYMLK